MFMLASSWHRPKFYLFSQKLVTITKAISEGRNIWIYGNGNGKTSLINRPLIKRLMEHKDYVRRINYDPIAAIRRFDEDMEWYSSVLVESIYPPPEDARHLFFVLEFLGQFNPVTQRYE